MLRPQSCSQQITGQDQLYQKLKEHLYYLIQWHGEHESAKTKLLQHFGHFLRAIHTIVAIFDPTWVFSNGVVTFKVANNGSFSGCQHHYGFEVQFEHGAADDKRSLKSWSG